MRGASGACGPKGQPYVDREGVFLSGGVGGGEGRAQKAGRQQEPLLVESLKSEEGTGGG